MAMRSLTVGKSSAASKGIYTDRVKVVSGSLMRSVAVKGL
jgi:hypothetical protein